MVGTVQRKQRYYTPYEVACHNSPDDCWLSCLGRVYDLTDLVRENEGPLAEPILRAAGTDVSHWFDAKTGDVKMHVCPFTNISRPHCPQARFIHVAPLEPTTTWNDSFGQPWWSDKRYQKGKLSARCRLVRVKNVLTQQEDTLEVPCEEALSEIRTRYQSVNAHSSAYVWKAFVPGSNGGVVLRELDMNLSLIGNGVVDESEAFQDCGLEEDFFLPVLHLYWSDDLTVA